MIVFSFCKLFLQFVIELVQQTWIQIYLMNELNSYLINRLNNELSLNNFAIGHHLITFTEEKFNDIKSMIIAFHFMKCVISRNRICGRFLKISNE